MTMPASLRSVLVLALALLLPPGCGGEEERGEKGKGSAPPRRSAAPAGENPGRGQGDGTVPPEKRPGGPTRPAARAGTFYPGDGETLARRLAELLGQAPDPALSGRLRALVAPHAGLRWSGATAAAAFKAVDPSRVERVFLIGPSHFASFTGLALPAAAAFATPLGPMTVDRKEVEALARHDLFRTASRPHRPEHALEMEVIFLRRIVPRAPIVPILCGSLDENQLRTAARTIRARLRERDLVVVSSDFTHYGRRFRYTPFTENIPERTAALADRAFRHLARLDPAAFLAHCRRTGDTICGRLPLALLLALLPPEAAAHKLRYDNSGRLSGDWSRCVSYLAVAFTAPHWKKEHAVPPPTELLDRRQQDLARKLAWSAMTTCIRKKRTLRPEDIGCRPRGPLLEQRGCFVTFKRQGRLRGCIGSIEATRPLWEDLIRRAIHAATQDPRFPPVTAGEIGELEMEISVLTPLREVESWREIVAGRDGILLKKGMDQAVFLPQVAREQKWNLETTLTHLAVKAGLSRDAWREGCRWFVFQAQVF